MEMKFAYMLVDIKNPDHKELIRVYDEIKKIQYVKDLEPLFGHHDLIAKLESEDHRDVACDLIDIKEEIKRIKGVTNVECFLGLDIKKIKDEYK